jgi:predicted secreted protein
MSWIEGIGAYIIIWWVVLFVMLPLGVKPAEEGDLGHATGAPANPRLWFKAGVATAVATVLWLILFALLESNLIQFG